MESVAGPTPTQMNPLYTLTSHFLKIDFHVIRPSIRRLTQVASSLQDGRRNAFLTYLTHAIYLVGPTFLNFIAPTSLSGEKM